MVPLILLFYALAGQADPVVFTGLVMAALITSWRLAVIAGTAWRLFLAIVFQQGLIVVLGASVVTLALWLIMHRLLPWVAARIPDRSPS